MLIVLFLCLIFVVFLDKTQVTLVVFSNEFFAASSFLLTGSPQGDRMISNIIKREPRTLVENKISFAAEHSELGIYDTYQAAKKVDLRSDQILFCGMVTGKKIMHINGDNIEFFPHESFILAPNQLVKIDFPIAKLDSPTTCIAIEIAPERVQQVSENLNSCAPMLQDFGEWQYNPTALHTHHSEQTQQLLTRIVSLYAENTPDRAYLIDLAINELSARLLRQQSRDFIIAHSAKDPEANQINRVIQYILSHLAVPIDIDHLCKIAVMGRTKFFNVFKNHLGCTPIAFQQQERLKLAAKLLERGMQITEAGFEVGFLNTSHFSKAFKCFFGQSPKFYQMSKLKPQIIN